MIYTIITMILVIPAGYLAGNSLVYCFNHLKPSLLGITGDEDRQRVNSHPWKLAFSFFFCVIGCAAAYKSWEITFSVIVMVWFLMLSVLSSYKFQILADKLVWLVGFCAIGFLPFSGNYLNMLFGSLLGFGIMLVLFLISKYLLDPFYKKVKFKDPLALNIWDFRVTLEDVFLITAAGLILRIEGVITVFSVSFFLLFCDFFIVKLRKKKKMNIYSFWLCIGILIYIIVLYKPKMW